MRAVIIGAGEVGKQLARVLCLRKNDVIVIDTDRAVLDQLKEEIDIMTVVGNGATGQILYKAGIGKANMLLAVTNNSEANILACTIARHFKVAEKIARIGSNEYFDASHGLTKATFGVDRAILPEYECATNIMDALLRFAVRETVKFDHPDAQMVNFQIKPESPMIGARLDAFPEKRIIDRLRVCAVLRFGELLIPRGDFSFIAFDEIYVAGDQDTIDELISWAVPNELLISKVIIAGATPLGGFLASMLATADMRVCIIEPKTIEAEHMADKLGPSALIIQGESTDISVLEEAGIRHCHAFIAAHLDDEVNILSCILAKNHGAAKTIAVTNHPDYVQIISGINMIDCCFSPLVSAVNALIKHVKTENRQTIAMLKRTSAEVLEMTVQEKAPVAGQKIRDIDIPAAAVFAIIIRANRLIPATGDERLTAGDHVIVFTKSVKVLAVEKMFASRGILK